jgi:hypothetical protein
MVSKLEVKKEIKEGELSVIVTISMNKDKHISDADEQLYYKILDRYLPKDCLRDDESDVRRFKESSDKKPTESPYSEGLPPISNEEIS